MSVATAVAALGCALLCAVAAVLLLRPLPVALARRLGVAADGDTPGDGGDGLEAAGRVGVGATLAVSAALLAVAGLTVPLEQAALHRMALAVGGALALPAVVVAYPLGLRDPRGTLDVVDRLGAVLVGGCGAVVVIAVLTRADLAFSVSCWVLTGLLVAVAWWRTERATGLARTRMLWLDLGVVAPGLAVGQVAFVVNEASHAPVAALLTAVAAALTAVVVGVRAPLAVDVRRLISQVTRYTVSVEAALALFGGAQAAATALAGHRPGIAATAVTAVAVAALFHPVSVVVQRVFDELLFGRRRDPVVVMGNLGEQLRTASTPAEWVTSLRADLGAARVELWDVEDLLAHAERDHAPTSPATTRVTLSVGGEPVGALVVVLDSPDEVAATHLGRLLELLAPPLARALHGLALTRELAGARAQALAALEEERRRLRRDLHDGLGPVLTGIAYSADAVRNLVRTDDAEARAEADALLVALRDDVAGSIAEVRRLVVGLRPPALDERGLVGAVRQAVGRLGAVHATSLQVSVSEEGLPPVLPAAVEVAAYRVAVEAVTNAARHAVPSGAVLTVTVGFSADTAGLAVEVADDGAPTAAWVAGVGTASMHERCEALHGSLRAGPTPAGGRVRALLPLTALSAESAVSDPP